MTREHVSASFAETMTRCPETARRVYVLGERQRPGAALIWGSADHAAHAVNFEQKVESWVDLPVSDVQDAFVDAVTAKVDEAGGEDEIEWGDETVAKVMDKGADLVATYHNEVSVSVQPIAVEQRLEVALPGVEVPVVAILDVETELNVIDRKTSARAEKKPKPQWGTQSMLYRALTGKPLDWHIVAKTGKVLTPEDSDDLHEPYSDALAPLVAKKLQHALDLYNFCLTTYGPDEPWPDAMSHPWACGFCGFRPTCPWWAK